MVFANLLSRLRKLRRPTQASSTQNVQAVDFSITVPQTESEALTDLVETQAVSQPQAQPQNYPKMPRMLMLDIDDESIEAVRRHYKVSVGSMGTPYKMNSKVDPYDYRRDIDFHVPIIRNHVLPDALAEHEVVIVDLAPKDILPERPSGEYWRNSAGENIKADWVPRRMHDPRAILAPMLEEEFGRIKNRKGGAFIIFASPRIGHQSTLYRPITDAWCFLDEFGPTYAANRGAGNQYNVEIRQDDGRDILVKPRGALTRLLNKYKDSMSYDCTFHPRDTVLPGWTPLAWDSYGEAVAGCILPAGEQQPEHPWLILVLPHIARRAEFLAELLTTVLPNYCPHLYPDLNLWLHDPGYELPGVQTRRETIFRLEEETLAEVTRLEAEIAQEEKDLSFLHDLLTRQDQPLVSAVRQTLQLLGFANVTEMDPVLVAKGEQPREDLQVEQDSQPILLVEVKGIGGLPTDVDAMQVAKHINIWKAELHTDSIQGLTIINHEMSKPPLERNNATLFRKDLITQAISQKVGLLTTWDLYRLALDYQGGKVSRRQLLTFFWKHGHLRYEAMPHLAPPDDYSQIGVIDNYFGKHAAVTVRLTEGELRLGDRIAFELPEYGGYREQAVDSLQRDNKTVIAVELGGLAGIGTQFTKAELKGGMRVFLVHTEDVTIGAEGTPEN